MYANQYGELIFQNYRHILLDSSDNKGVHLKPNHQKFFSNQVLLVCCKFIKHVTLNLTIKFNYFAKLTENEGLRQTWKNCPGDP